MTSPHALQSGRIMPWNDGSTLTPNVPKRYSQNLISWTLQ